MLTTTPLEIWQTIKDNMRFRLPAEIHVIRTTKWWVTNQNNIRTESAHLVFNNYGGGNSRPLTILYPMHILLGVVQIHNENLLIGMTPEQYLDSLHETLNEIQHTVAD